MATKMDSAEKAFEAATLETAAKPASVTNPSASGPVPEYLSNQLANYQAALARLGG